MKEKLQKSLIMIVLILSMLALAACSKSDEDDDEESGRRRRRTENVEPTDDPDVTSEPTVEPTKEPAAEITPEPGSDPVLTLEPTVTPTKEPATAITPVVISGGDDEKKEGDNGDIPATGKPEPTGDIEPVITGDPYDNGFVYEEKIIGYTDTEDAAKEAAEAFGNAFIIGDKDEILNTIAYDADKKNKLTEDLSEFQGIKESVLEKMSEYDLAIADIDLEELVYLECVGGMRLDKRTAVENLFINDTYINDPMEWEDYHIFSTEIKGKLISLIGNPIDEGINIIVAERDGEYKVITVAYYDETDTGDDPDDPGTDEEILMEIKGKLYQFNGNETPDEIIDTFNKAFEDFDFYTMISCIAIDDSFYIDAVEDNDDALETFELAKTIPGSITVTAKRGEAVPATEEELNDIRINCPTLENAESVTDLVKYEIEYHMEIGEETQDQTETVYVGKYNGEYRIVQCFIFE